MSRSRILSIVFVGSLVQEMEWLRLIKSRTCKRYSIVFEDIRTVCSKPEVPVSIFKQCRHCRTVA